MMTVQCGYRLSAIRESLLALYETVVLRCVDSWFPLLPKPVKAR